MNNTETTSEGYVVRKVYKVIRPEPRSEVPGDRTRAIQLFVGAVPMPPLTSAKARWEWRQAEGIRRRMPDAKAMLGVLNQLMEELTPKMQELSLRNIRDQIAEFVEQDVAQDTKG